MRIGVMLGHFFMMMLGMKSVSVSGVGMMGRLYMIAGGVMFGRFMMMLRGVFVVFCRLFVVFVWFVCHRGLLSLSNKRIGLPTISWQPD
jgi:hypothetical protein